MNYEVTQVCNDNCSSESDLGVIFDSNLLFDDHIDKAVKKANQALGMIKRAFTFLSKNVFISLYKSLKRPHLENGNVIWYPFHKRQSAAVEKLLKNSYIAGRRNFPLSL